jgi:hypothetical protein
MRKFIKIVFSLLIILIITISAFYQNKAEKYINRQKKLYGILENKKRNRYVPFGVFLVTVFNTKQGNEIYRHMYTPYIESKKYKGGAHVDMYDCYIYYCYY